MSERAKADLQAMTYRAERAIDGLFTALGKTVAASVKQHAERGKVTPLTRHRVLTDLDEALDAIYGPAHGQPSPLAELIVRVCGETRMTVVDAAVKGIRTALKGEKALLRAMGDVEA